MPYDLSLMYIGAHPDDEGSCSGSLAKYAEMGGRAFVVIATRGDGVDAKIQEGVSATRESLGQVRVDELRCACEKLGVEPPVVLGYQDGEVGKVDPEAAARNLARLMRQLKPAVVITHDPEGGYGHPDHIAVQRFTLRAVEMAGDAAHDLGAAPFAPAKLYYTALPRSYLERVPAFRERRAEIGGKVLTFLGVPDEQITTEVDIQPWLEKKLDALTCHRTQFEIDAETGRPKTFARGLPEDEQLRLFGHERFVLARANTPLNGKEIDLFAGVELAQKSDKV
jgi:N-acetyl-1-D-myo-inositol-2-amino-2-deoxy-alpha-D-glucopyranoside deacetylase